MFYAINRGQLNIGQPQFGFVTSVDASGYNIKVMLQPDEVETGFIPYGTSVYGWVAPPKGGELALVLFQGGQKNVPIGAILFYWDGFRAPGITTNGDTAAGEMLLRHSSGSYVKLDNTGKVLINGNTEIDVTAPTLNVTTTQAINLTATNSVTIQAPTINLKGDVVLDGNLTTNSGNTTIINGVITTNANIVTSQDVQASGISLKTHVHGGVTTGSGDTGAPV